MKRAAKELLIAAALLGGVACIHTVRDSPYRSNVSSMQLGQGQVLDSSGAPMSGVLVARDADIPELCRSLFAGTVLEGLAGADAQGLILRLSVKEGRAHGHAELFVDLRSPKLSKELMDRKGQFSLLVGTSIAPVHKIGDAHFKDGLLEGAVTLLSPNPRLASDARRVATVEFHGGKLHGVATEFRPGTATPKRELHFAQGRMDGTQRYYYRSGNLEREVVYAGGAPNGEAKEFYADGAKRAVLSFEAGAPSGPQRRWYPSGQLEEEVTSTPEGLVVNRWYSNGAPQYHRSASSERNHPPHGTVEDFYSSGALRTRRQFEAGVPTGQVQRFYEDGQLWEEAHFDAGQAVGTQKKWWKNGQLALEAHWDKGALHGSYRRFYASGQAWEEVQYLGGKRQGPYKRWWKNGAVAHDYLYVDGKIHGEYQTFYDNGAAWARGLYESGKPRGTHQRWFPDGKLGYIMEHAGGRPHGSFKRWWADGTPRLEATYDRGRYDGVFKNWNEDGSVFEVATFERGKKISTTRRTPGNEG